jgi:heme/copper-type cytochrome/quinol oxidase subunit 2
MFVGKIPEVSVASWIIVLAIIIGVLILLLISMALHKVRTTDHKIKISNSMMFGG